MEVLKPDTQNQSPGNTRIKHCSNQPCESTTVETYLETSRFMGKVYHAWVQDSWPSPRGFCNTCEISVRAKEERIREEQQRIAREKLREKQRDEFLKSFGGEKPVKEFTFDRFDGILNLTAFKKAKAFNPLEQNLFFYGPSGTGKTHLACAIAREQFERGMLVEFYKVPNLMREFRRRMDPDDEDRFIKHLVAVPVLVIDDLGVGKATEYVIEKLHEVIDGRQNNYFHGLVITSNLSLNGIAETFKDRIADRLNGMCELIKMDGDSQRKRS